MTPGISIAIKKEGWFFLFIASRGTNLVIKSTSLFVDSYQAEIDVPTLDLSIIVVNYKAMDYLRQCLDSIEQTAGDMDYEVIVVDNGSVDCSAHFVGASASQNPGRMWWAL